MTIPSNLLAHHLDVLEDAGLIERSRSSGDGRRRYVHLRPGAPRRTSHPQPSLQPQPALFVCTANSARSQLAAALWTTITGAPPISAGTHPADRVHPGAVAAGRRAGLDLTDAPPRSRSTAVRRRPALTITVCDRAHEELDPGPGWLHWSIPDPVPAGTRARVRRHRRRAPSPHHRPGRCGMTELDRAPETGTGDLPVDLGRRLVAEALGTGLLIVAVIGSGIMASRLSPDDVGLQLLENAAATAGALIGLILIFGAVSGAHFNPVVTLVDRAFGIDQQPRHRPLHRRPDHRRLPRRRSSPTSCSTSPPSSGPPRPARPVRCGCPRSSPPSGCCSSSTAASAPAAPTSSPSPSALWIGGAYWFTTSTSFANPAVTIARTLSDTFAGIKPSSAPMFIVMQLARRRHRLRPHPLPLPDPNPKGGG